MVRDYLKLTNDFIAPPSINDVIAKIAADTGITVALLIGERRTRQLARIRHYAYWRVAQETTVGVAAIGRAFGDRCHSTIAHGIRQHEDRLLREGYLRGVKPKTEIDPLRTL